MQLLLKQGAEFIPDYHYARSLKAMEEMSVELLIKHLQANYEFVCIFRLGRLATKLRYSKELKSTMHT